MEEPRILYGDENFLAVYKPAGLLTHAASARGKRPASSGRPPRRDGARPGTQGERTADHERALVGWLLERYPEIRAVGDDPGTRPGIVHRLDKDTSGVLLVARNQEWFLRLKSLFQNREVKKTYLAVVAGVPRARSGTITLPIGRKSGTVRRSIHAPGERKAAVTRYRVIRAASRGGEQFALLEVIPETGRTHQIRVHLASIGHPVAGDSLYGPKKPRAVRRELSAPRLMLHALALEFSPAPGKRLRVEAEPPPGFADFLRAAG